MVIDDDLGKTAASAEGRAGFQRLVAEVTLDHVGIILGVEMSRLARSCKDWYQLLEVCAVFGTLIADLDGVYDPSQYNDRLLLGLKGTMSEAELHILKQRMNQGRLNKARRGELFINLPIGYLRRPSGEVDLDPDEQAQETVRLVFRKFEELGTLNALLRFLVDHDIRMPVRARSGSNKGELEWNRPNRMTLQNLLKNPMYAGVYTYGRRAVDPRRKLPGRPSTGRTIVEPEDCQVFLRDRFPAYISWNQYERNRERLRANRSVSESVGAARNGPALLCGLLICGKCGCRMSVAYDGNHRHSYRCVSQLSNYGGRTCQSLAGPPLDLCVSERVLVALSPASLQLSLTVAQNIEEQRRELDSLWRQRLERARYEAERAEREFRHVEPEHRLVARQLEERWEQKLREERRIAEDYDRVVREQPKTLTHDEREAIRTLAADIPALWEAEATTPLDRKEIMRQVIDRVVVDVVGESERVRLLIEWAGGARSEAETRRPVARLEQLSYWPELAERMRDLVSNGLSASAIAQRLNDEGYRPPKRNDHFTEIGVQRLIERLRLRSRRPRGETRSQLGVGPHEWLVGDLSRELDMPIITLYSWIRRGWVRARRSERGRWILPADAAELVRLRDLRRVPHGHHTRRHWVTEDIENSITTKD